MTQFTYFAKQQRVTEGSYTIDSSENKMETKFCKDICKAVYIEKANLIFLNTERSSEYFLQ